MQAVRLFSAALPSSADALWCAQQQTVELLLLCWLFLLPLQKLCVGVCIAHMRGVALQAQPGHPRWHGAMRPRRCSPRSSCSHTSQDKYQPEQSIPPDRITSSIASSHTEVNAIVLVRGPEAIFLGTAPHAQRFARARDAAGGRGGRMNCPYSPNVLIPPGFRRKPGKAFACGFSHVCISVALT